MPIIYPITKTKISSSQWGIPITDEVNRLTAALAAAEAKIAAMTPGPWINVTSFQNGWINIAGWQPAQYRKIGDNVQVRGYIQGGPANTIAFNLPVGYRAPRTITLTSNTYTTVRVIQMVQCGSDGNFIPEAVGNTDLTFWYSTLV